MDDASPYDALLAKHLRSVPQDRLYVGEDLQHVNWAGVEETYGSFLTLYPHEGLVALYDRSFLGLGRTGFLVTDWHLHYVQASSRGTLALDHVRRAHTLPEGVLVTTGFGTEEQGFVELRMTDRDLIHDMAAWLEAVGGYNVEVREQGNGRLSAAAALERLEYLESMHRLTAHERAWLLRIALTAAQRDA